MRPCHEPCQQVHDCRPVQLRATTFDSDEQHVCLVTGAREAVAAAGREWGDAAAAVAERVAALQGLLRDNMDAGTPAAELRRLLASGAVSAPLRQWLTASLGERQPILYERALHSAMLAFNVCTWPVCWLAAAQAAAV